jgi:hypothetical protein
MRLLAPGFTAAAAAVLAAGCEKDPPAPFCPGGQCVSQQTRRYGETRPPRMVDLLLVIDDSPSMRGKQAAVLERLQRVVASTFPGLPGRVDLEMRVISTTAVGTAAGVPGCAAQRSAACAAPAPGVFRWNQTCGAGSNFEGPVDAAATCAARFDADGCPIEQPLAALEAELRRSPPRPEAYLFVVIVTDEDDCSFSSPPFALDPSATAGDPAELSARCRDADAEGRLEPLSRYVDFVHSLKRPEHVLVSLVAGPCTGDGLDAPRAPRLERFASAWKENAVFTSLCAADWRSVLAPLGQWLWFTPLVASCLPEGLVDRDPAAPGIQPDCAFSERLNATGEERAIPACDTGAVPCWTAMARPDCTSSLTYEIDRGGCFPAGGALINIACATRPL